MEKIKIGIVGGAGYTGGELIRLLLRHPHADIAFIHSKSNAGNPVATVHADLLGETELVFTDALSPEVQVWFLCLGHGEARKFLDTHPVEQHIRIIDLSHDFRLAGKATYNGRNFVYGLPELNKTAIRQAHHIANPGCFATAIQLGLLPLAKAGLLQEVCTTGITGSTGAGQALAATSHFSWRANNIQAYKTLTHQHLNEIGESLLQLQPAFGGQINFVPWRGDFTRGIFVSSQLHCTWPLADLVSLYREFYRDHPFTVLSEAPICLKQAVNTNKCMVQLEQQEDRLVVHTAIDNLLKGASGQAVQNMNLLFGFDEQAGLQLKAGYF